MIGQISIVVQLLPIIWWQKLHNREAQNYRTLSVKDSGSKLKIGDKKMKKNLSENFLWEFFLKYRKLVGVTA